MEGRQLGRYELVRKIGAGGMGEVWDAILCGPRGFRRRVALKILHAAPVEGREEALTAEARLGALLNHPNVCAVHELGRIDGRWFMAMELVDGPAVGALVKRTRLSARNVVEIGLQAARGLAHIHGLRIDGAPAGLVHRDVKPGNVLVDPYGQVKLVDLGIARLAGSTSSVQGTPSYMAPEQITGAEDARADLFALGATLYALAARRRPFGSGEEALRSAQDVESHLARPEFLAAVDRPVPGLGEILRGCLRLRPGDRVQDADALVHELSALLQELEPSSSLAARVAEHRAEAHHPPLRDSFDAQTPDHGSPTTIVLDTLPPPVELIGRSDALDRVLEALAMPDRVVSLVGAGGMGKTTLGVRAARVLARRMPGGALFCDLSEVRDLDGVHDAVADVLGVPVPRRDAARGLGDVLRLRGASLLVLDNLEQVARWAGPSLDTWVDAAPDSRFLVTSQVRLGLRCEHVEPVGPLDTEHAVALFVARAPRPIEPTDEPAVARVVERLDGMPLAIELAAARLRLLTVERLEQRLEDRFRLLTKGGAHRPARHRSLQASLDASWELLTTHERAAMAQLSVFRGGFDLDACDAVLDLSAHPAAPWTLDVLGDLIDHSLLRFDPAEERFRMLVAVQEYAALQLHDSAPTEARHGAWYAQLGAQPARLARSSHGGPTHRRRLQVDLENVQAACARAIARGDAGVAIGAALAACDGLRMGGLRDATRLLLVGAQALPGAKSLALDFATSWELWRAGRRDEARALAVCIPDRFDGREARGRHRYLLAKFHSDLGEHASSVVLLRAARDDVRQQGLRAFEGAILSSLSSELRSVGRIAEGHATIVQALEVQRDQGDRRAEARSLDKLAWLLHDLGRGDEAREAFSAALAVQRELGQRHREADLLAAMAMIEAHTDGPAGAEAPLRSAIAIHRDIGALRPLASVLVFLSVLRSMQGRFDEAVAILREAVDLYRRLTGKAGLGRALTSMAEAQWRAGHSEAALATLDEAIAVGEASGQPRVLAVALGFKAEVALSVDDVQGAGSLVAEATALLGPTGYRRGSAAMAVISAQVARARGELEAALDLARGAAATFEECRSPPDLPWVWALQGQVLVDLGREADAERLCQKAEGVVRDLDIPASSAGQDVARLRARLS